MKNYFFAGAFLLTLALDLFVIGCTKSPLSPARAMALNISIPMNNDLRAEFLGNSYNSLYYRVDGANGVSLLEGTTGPLSEPASTGAIDLDVPLPPGAKLLSLQLNTYYPGVGAGGPPPIIQSPLAIGALAIDSLGAGTANAVVEMGSVTRNCYYVNYPASYAYYTYGFSDDNLVSSSTVGPNYDIQVDYFGNSVLSFYLADASGNTLNSIAYMGNGNLVDHDGVPDASRFSSASTICKTAALGADTNSIEAGDIYCVKLNTIPGGFAWIQMLTAGSFPTCPSFIFRVNKSLPYYAYDQTAADSAGGCSVSW